MPTTFIVQGTVMSNAFGIFDVASMNSLDALSVLFFGSITANYVYPYLARKGIKIPTTYKFAIGSALGSLAIVWAIFVENMIHTTYHSTGEKVNVLWQAPCYMLIGLGEIFAVSAAYEVAFTASPPDKKVLASATNIFCVGGLPNMICITLYHSCSKWFTNSNGTTNIGHIEDYTTAHVGKYFTVLLSVMVFGIILNVQPWVKGYVESIEERATELVKTPHIGKSPPIAATRRGDQEATPLLATTPRTRKYQEYLKYGSGPVYARSGSMRAGPSLSRSDLPGGKVKKVKRKFIPKLYGSQPEAPRVQVATGLDGKPIKAGILAKK
jgi:POT family proton-dependent oligopeptide transporter